MSLVCAPIFLVHLVSIALTKALQSYSRSRLEERTEALNRPHRADEIAHLDHRTERASESIAVLSGLFLASAIGIATAHLQTPAAIVVLIFLICVLGVVGYVVAGVVGEVFAEPIIDSLWPATTVIRASAFPLTLGAEAIERIVEWSSGSDKNGPRPASLEVEVPNESEDDEDQEPEIPEKARDLLSRVVELTRTNVSEIMQPRSAIVALPATVTAEAAAEAFRKSGRSRIPLYGSNRDDIVGMLLAKDLLNRMLVENDSSKVVPAAIARPVYRVPETKNAFNLLEEMRFRRAPMAIVLDEYGGVAGLVTIEDLLEQLVGPIHDEYDAPAPADPIVPLGGSKFELDASVDLEDLNERFGVHLPTDDEYQTIGGLALHVLGRLPEPGAAFSYEGLDFTVLEVADRSIRRLKMDLQPGSQGADSRTGRSA
ncbi:MAG: hemolysin family protein [Paludisphaera borealis]|uniref:hemolysin family protein n=1 Tax=Paludisphaera borealis TaxID=1387353 RepID=UPI00284D3E63|nr:hemolysin family protein [Paludisphaera borealis]MDR3619805.1 hemolysin family protein [Paludisphaera borealis]